MIVNQIGNPAVVDALMGDALVVLKTDTIYGILALASSQAAVDKLYAAKHRDTSKSCIVLVSSLDEIPGLSKSQQSQYAELNNDRPTTVVVNTASTHLPHLIRQSETLAFRLVRPSELGMLIEKTGPLLAPSANTEGSPPARNIEEAVEYFGNNVAVYVDSGTVASPKPSRIITPADTGFDIIRL